MELKSKSGKYLMPDDPVFDPILQAIAARNRLGKEYSPFGPVLTVKTFPVPTAVSVIVTPGTTASVVFTNTGNLTIASAGNFTDLFINGAVTLTGSGSLNLQNAARVRGSGTLFNGGPNGEVSTIRGETSNSGSLGTNELAIVNRSGGLINADDNSGNNLALVVDPSAAGNLINLGTMRASNTGVLLLTGNGGGVFTNTGGVIEALAGAQVRLQDGATVVGGTLRTVGSGVIRNFNSATLNSLTNSGNFTANNNTSTTVIGTIVNNGRFLVDPSNQPVYLVGDAATSGWAAPFTE
jgi:hypothetical protein